MLTVAVQRLHTDICKWISFYGSRNPIQRQWN